MSQRSERVIQDKARPVNFLNSVAALGSLPIARTNAGYMTEV